MTFKKVSELEILPEHVEALVPTQAFELGRMLAAVHAGRQRAAF
jgi:hypothetical protein